MISSINSLNVTTSSLSFRQRRKSLVTHFHCSFVLSMKLSESSSTCCSSTRGSSLLFVNAAANWPKIWWPHFPRSWRIWFVMANFNSENCSEEKHWNVAICSNGLRNRLRTISFSYRIRFRQNEQHCWIFIRTISANNWRYWIRSCSRKFNCQRSSTCRSRRVKTSRLISARSQNTSIISPTGNGVSLMTTNDHVALP